MSHLARCNLAGSPLDLIASETLRWKVQEPILLLGKQRFAGVDIRIRAKGGGHVSQIYGRFVTHNCCAATRPTVPLDTYIWAVSTMLLLHAH